jgi:hypothetical protein
MPPDPPTPAVPPDNPTPTPTPKFYLPLAFVAECYDAGQWRPLSEYAEPPALPDTPDGLLAHIRRLRARLAEAVRKSLALGCDGIGGINARFPLTLVNKAVFLRTKDGYEYAYFLPAIEPLWTAAAAAGVEKLPPWNGEPQSDPEAIQMLDALAESLQAAVARAEPGPHRMQAPMANAFHAQLADLTPRFQAGRDIHPNVWMLEAAYPLGSEVWTNTVHGLGPSGEFEYQEPHPRPAVHELYMTASIMWEQRSTSRPLLPFPEAVASARLIQLRRSNPHPITPEVGKYNSWEQAIYLFGASEDVTAFIAAAAEAGKWPDPIIDCPPFNSHLEGIPLHSDPVSQWCARVHAAIDEVRPTCLWSSSPMRGGFQVRLLLDMDPWEASVLAISLVLAQETDPPAKEPPPEGAEFTEDDAPAAFRDGGKMEGAVLTGPYLETTTDWELLRPYISRNYGPGKTLTTHIKVGRAKAYLFKEVAALRTIKTQKKAAREERP